MEMMFYFENRGSWFKRARYAAVYAVVVSAAFACAQTAVPEWCRALPRPEYKTLAPIQVSDNWFEVYRVARPFSRSTSRTSRKKPSAI